MSYWEHTRVDVSSFKGVTFKSITVSNEEITFVTDDGTEYKMAHDQDCCECVVVEEIIGEINDLVDTPILVSEERTQDGSEYRAGLLSDETPDGLETWTFYEFRTIKGSVTIRWFGSSNGYYSTDVDVYQICKQ